MLHLTTLVAASVGEMTFWQRIPYLLSKYGMSFLRGAGNTMLIAIVATAIGCVIGFAVGIVQTIPLTKKDSLLKRIVVRFFQILLNIYVEVFRGTPMMIQAMFIYYGAAALFNIHMETLRAAFLIVSINTGAYMAETVRGGILSIDPGQTEGAKAIGMTHVQTMLYVILPQTLRNILPQIGNNLIINIKDTFVLSVISVVELFFVFRGVAGAMYTYFEAATITMPNTEVSTHSASRTISPLRRTSSSFAPNFRMPSPPDFVLLILSSIRHSVNPKVCFAKNARIW